MAEDEMNGEVIAGVISSVRETFESEGLDANILEKLEQLWISKLKLKESTSKGKDDDETPGDKTEVVTPAENSPQPVAKPKKKSKKRKDKAILQVDGPADTSDDEDDDDEKDEKDDDDDEGDSEGSLSDELDPDGEKYDDGIDDEPLCSEDDNSDEEANDLFDTENVVVCQYDKITRAKNKWKFHLKDGIMNLNGRDYVFQRAHGEAEW